eukprot:1153223-Pelagomonas_calceolata.AAC.15
MGLPLVCCQVWADGGWTSKRCGCGFTELLSEGSLRLVYTSHSEDSPQPLQTTVNLPFQGRLLRALPVRHSAGHGLHRQLPQAVGPQQRQSLDGSGNETNGSSDEASLLGYASLQNHCYQGHCNEHKESYNGVIMSEQEPKGHAC